MGNGARSVTLRSGFSPAPESFDVIANGAGIFARDLIFLVSGYDGMDSVDEIAEGRSAFVSLAIFRGHAPCPNEFGQCAPRDHRRRKYREPNVFPAFGRSPYL